MNLEFSKTTHNVYLRHTYYEPHTYTILNLNRIASRPNVSKSYLQNLSNALFRYILENILLKKQFILKTLDTS